MGAAAAAASAAARGLRCSLLRGRFVLALLLQRLERALPLPGERDGDPLQLGQLSDELAPAYLDGVGDRLCCRSGGGGGAPGPLRLVEELEPLGADPRGLLPEDVGEGGGGTERLELGVQRAGRSLDGEQLAHEPFRTVGAHHGVDGREVAGFLEGGGHQPCHPVALACHFALGAAGVGSGLLQRRGRLFGVPPRPVVGLCGLSCSNRGCIHLRAGEHQLGADRFDPLRSGLGRRAGRPDLFAARILVLRAVGLRGPGSRSDQQEYDDGHGDHGGRGRRTAPYPFLRDAHSVPSAEAALSPRAAPPR